MREGGRDSEKRGGGQKEESREGRDRGRTRRIGRNGNVKTVRDRVGGSRRDGEREGGS